MFSAQDLQGHGFQYIVDLRFTRTWIPVYSRSQVSVYRTIGPPFIYAYEDNYY